MVLNKAGAYQPQWSPPLVGGMTAGALLVLAVIVAPQWSPPLVGGMTPSSNNR